MPEPTGSPAAPTPSEDKTFVAISDTLSKLGDSISGITERLDEFEETIGGLTPPPPPETQTTEPKWKPKVWDEFPEMAKTVAQQTYEEMRATETQAAAEEVESNTKKEKELLTQIDKDFDGQLESLEKDGMIPSVKDINDPNDEGRMARKELFAMGIKANSPDLVAMANYRNELIDLGLSFDIPSGKFIKSNPAPFGASAPVGSSARSTTTANKPTYKEIHNLSMDEIVRRYNS